MYSVNRRNCGAGGREGGMNRKGRDCVCVMLTGELFSSDENTTRVLYIYIKVNVMRSRFRTGVGIGIALLFHDRGTRKGELSATRLGRTLHQAKFRCQLYRRLVWPYGYYEWTEYIVPTGIRSWTVESVA